MLAEHDYWIMAQPQSESCYLNMKVNSMKSTILAAAILISLAGPVSVLAEAPAVIVKPYAAKVVPIDVESTVQQTVVETTAEAEAPLGELSEQQAVVETFSAATVPPGDPAESREVSAEPAVAPAPATSMIDEQTATVTPLGEVAAGAGATGTVTPKQPCPTKGMGMMRKGMGQGGRGPGCRKPCCDRLGGGQPDKHEQVVRRLDMIEARIAKIEAMLESLMQR